MVIEVPGLNLLGRDAIKALGLPFINFAEKLKLFHQQLLETVRCLCQSFQTELGCLLDVRLKTEF